ncbi:MAG: hypothetical protein JXB10_10310 [Pirellulales bacterium]|nr:hypothetical protein [Pirellulales bacterium]
MLALSKPSLVARWHRRFGAGRRQRVWTRPVAGLGYLANGPVIDGLIEIEHLVLVVLYDEPRSNGRLALRLAGFSGTAAPWGVKWGGPEQCRFDKDLLLRPTRHARGQRIDTASKKLLQVGLQLDRQLEKHARYPGLVYRNRLQLPRLRAGFRALDAARVTGDGPELAEYCRRSGKSACQALYEARYFHEGLTMFPLAWVSHLWENVTAVFVDLDRFPRWQVFPLRRLPEDLQGFSGAAEYDFVNSRFRSFTPHREARPIGILNKRLLVE